MFDIPLVCISLGTLGIYFHFVHRYFSDPNINAG